MAQAYIPSTIPMDVLANTMANSSTRRKANLKIIFDVCAQLASDNIPITIAKVGALSVAAGGVAAQSIRNSQGESFRSIIIAWQTYVSKTGDAPFTDVPSRTHCERRKHSVSETGLPSTEREHRTFIREDIEPLPALNAVDFVASCDAVSFAEVMAAGLKRLLREGWQIDDQGRLVDSWGELLPSEVPQ